MPAARAAARLLLALSAALLLLSAAAAAQSSPTGTLTGTVLDQNGAAVPGTVMTARHAGKGQTRTAGADGEERWTLAALPVGAYEVTFEAPNFRKTVRANVLVEAAVPHTLDVHIRRLRQKLGPCGDAIETVLGVG